MRQKRAKAYKRVMALYTQTFGFRTPFQVLVSNDIMLKCPSDVSLPRLLQSCVQAECKLMITQCCVEALYKLGREHQRVIDLAKRFERRKCNHREAIEPNECLKDVVGATNKHNYVLSAQSLTLRQSLQHIPGLPIIHFNARQVLVLSPPSQATIRHKNEMEEARRTERIAEMGDIVDGGNVIGANTSGLGVAGPSSSTNGVGQVRARKKVKGPNPLSVKKKKGDKEKQKEQENDGVRGKRSREEQVELEPDEGVQVDGGDAEGDGSGRRKKKRKRGKGKGAVAEARAELAANDGDGDGASGAESD